MTGTLNQAIQPKVVGPLFKKGGSMFPVQSYLELGLVPLLKQGTRATPREAGQSPEPRRVSASTYGRTKFGLSYCSLVIGMD